MRLLELDRPARLELPAQVEQQLRDLRAAVELRLDPAEHATAIPERAALAGTAFGMTVGDQLDRAEGPVVVGWLHTVTVAAVPSEPIGAPADPATGSY